MTRAGLVKISYPLLGVIALVILGGVMWLQQNQLVTVYQAAHQPLSMQPIEQIATTHEFLRVDNLFGKITYYRPYDKKGFTAIILDFDRRIQLDTGIGVGYIVWSPVRTKVAILGRERSALQTAPLAFLQNFLLPHFTATASQGPYRFPLFAIDIQEKRRFKLMEALEFDPETDDLGWLSDSESFCHVERRKRESERAFQISLTGVRKEIPPSLCSVEYIDTTSVEGLRIEEKPYGLARIIDEKSGRKTLLQPDPSYTSTSAVQLSPSGDQIAFLKGRPGHSRVRLQVVPLRSVLEGTYQNLQRVDLDTKDAFFYWIDEKQILVKRTGYGRYEQMQRGNSIFVVDLSDHPPQKRILVERFTEVIPRFLVVAPAKNAFIYQQVKAGGVVTFGNEELIVMSINGEVLGRLDGKGAGWID